MDNPIKKTEKSKTAAGCPAAVCSWFLCLFLQIVRRTFSGEGTEDPAEIELVPVSHHLRDILDKQAAALPHQLFCLFHAQLCEVLGVRTVRIFAEKLAHISLRYGKLITQTLQGQRLCNMILQILLDDPEEFRRIDSRFLLLFLLKTVKNIQQI